LLPAMFQLIGGLAKEGNDEPLTPILEEAHQLVQHRYALVVPHAPQLLKLFTAVASAQSLDAANTRLAMGVVVEMARRGGSALRNVKEMYEVTPVAISFLGRLELSLEEWADKSADADFEEEDFRVGMETLDYLSMYLGAKNFFPTVFMRVREGLSSQDWKFRHSALMAICAVCEGCAEEIAPALQSLVTAIIPRITGDAHPRVRWAACNLCAHLCAEFSPALQQAFGDKLIPVLCRAMAQESYPRVCNHASLCIVDYCAGDEEKTIVKYLKPVLTSLRNLLAKGGQDLRVVSGALAALSSVAATAGTEAFNRYYGEFIPGVMMVLDQATKAASAAKQHNINQLGHKAMERLRWAIDCRKNAVHCVGILAEVAGPSLFEKDSKNVMTLLARAQKSLRPEDPAQAEILAAFNGISGCLGEKFAPYLQHVVPPLIKAALAEGAEMLEADGQREAKEGYELFAVHLRGVGKKQVAINTAMIDAKAEACHCLGEYAKNLPNSFQPYVQASAQAMIKCLQYIMTPRVRSPAAQCVAFLVNCANQRGPNAGFEVFKFTLPHMLKALTVEDEPDHLTVILEALSDAVDYLKSGMPTEFICKINEVLRFALTESLRRRAEYIARLQDQIDDAEQAEIEQYVSLENEMIGMMVAVIKSCAHNAKGSYIEDFHKQLFPLFSEFLAEKASPPLQTSGICCMCDVIESLPRHPINQQYAKQFITLTMQRSNHASVDVKQSAVYGVGVCAEALTNAGFAPYCRDALNVLSTVITKGDFKDEGAPVRDNAISSVAKIAEVMGGDVARSVLPRWLQWLPCVDDPMEAKVVHRKFCQFLEAKGDQGNNPLYGENLRNLPKIFSIICRVLPDTDLREDATKEHMINIIKYLAQNLGAQRMRGVLQQLDAEEQKVIQSVLS